MKTTFRYRVLTVSLALLFGLGTLGITPISVRAADIAADSLSTVGETSGLGSEDPRLIVGNIIRYALGFIGVILVCFVVYAGFVWMTAAGNPEKVDTAKKILINAIIGLLIVLFSWSIVTFVMGSLLRATGGSGGGGGGGGGSSTGGGLGGGSGSQFEVTGFSPEGEVSIRNIVARITLSKTVDEATVAQSVSVVDASGTPVDGVLTVSGNVVRFTPNTACPEPNADRFCFDEQSVFTIRVTEELESLSGDALVCSESVPCSAQFTSGTLVDTEDPSASVVVPESGDSVSVSATMDVQVYATDDAGIAAADFSIEDEWQDSVSASESLTETTIDATLSTESFVSGERYTVSVTVFDLAGNEDTDSVSVEARPLWCFNGVEDVDLGEEGIDCGGDASSTTYCGACDGSSCTEDAACASGACLEGVCVSVPTISGISPISGAVGTTVTISGTDFGANTGSVFFTDSVGTGTVEAQILSECADGWSETQILVSVPEGAGDGPIALTTSNGDDETTDDETGATVPNFDVNDIEMPSLCSLSQDSGRAESALRLEGTNFGDSQGDSVITFSSIEAGSYTSWANDAAGVTVPNTSSGNYDVAVVVGGNSSNTLTYMIEEPIAEASTITGISPDAGGIGQYVTISGTNFGSSIGTVMFEAADGSVATADIDFPDACAEDFWSTDEVTVMVPALFQNGDTVAEGEYQVYVKNNEGTNSTTTSFTVTNDAPTPGICAITSSGDVGDTITISGDHFGTSTDTVTFYNGVTNTGASRWTNDEIALAVSSGAQTGPVTVTVAGAVSNAVNFAVGAGESDETASTVSAAYAWSFSTGEILEVPRIVSECSEDVVSAVPNEAFSEAAEVCVNAVVYAEFTTLMNEASVADAISVSACVGDGDAPCETLDAISGTPSTTPTSVTWIPSGDLLPNTTYRVTIATSAMSTDAIALAAEETWDFTTSANTAPCIVDRVTVAPAQETLTVDGQTASLTAQAGTGCVIVDSGDYVWDWSVDSYSYIDFSSTNDDCIGDPTACATFEALSTEGDTIVTATAMNSANGAYISDDALLTVNFSDPYIVSYWPDCTEACTNAEVGASFNTVMNANDITSGENIAVYSCSNELCTSLTLVDAHPACRYADTAETQCNGFAFDGLSLVAGEYYRVIVSGDVRSSSAVPLIRTNYGDAFSWTFRVREDGTLCAVERIELSPSSAVAGTIGETAAFTVEAFGAADSCSTSGQRLVGSDFAWNWEDAAHTVFPAIADDAQNMSTEYSTAAWTTQSGALLDGGADVAAEGCSERCTPVGSAAYDAVCGDGVLDQDTDGSGEECDDGNIADHDGCSSTCVYEGSPSCSFTCSSTGAACSADSECTETCDTSTSLCSVSGVACTTNSDCPYVASTCGTTGTLCCGNSVIEVQYGSDIAEDCDDGNRVDGDGCSAACLAEGSAAIGATCGNGDVAYDALTQAGEECDDRNNASGDGCSRLCLREGSQSSVATGGAECGDNVVTTPYETCDDGNAVNNDGCSSICVREGLSQCSTTTDTNCCGNGAVEIAANGAGEDCDGQEGCSNDCTFEGSSVGYSVPSVCGDGVAGLGEYPSCESASASGDGNPDSTQVAYITDEASLEVSTETNLAIANISVTEPSSNLTAAASWTLSCTAEDDQDCSDPDVYAAGATQCCVPRPAFVASGPLGNDVCLNAAISVTFDAEMDTGSFVTSVTEGNETTKSSQMYVALNRAAGQSCPEGYTTSQYLSLNWIQRLVATVKVFLLGPIAEAAVTTDCVVPVQSFSQIPVGDGTYKVTVNTGIALEANSSYTFVIRGDENTSDDIATGVSSVLGAAMRGSQSVTFMTGSEMCALDAVDVIDAHEDSPNVFTHSGETHAFTATAISYHGNTRQEIAGVAGVYDWTWSSWGSGDDALFTVAQDGEAEDTATVTVLNDNGDATVTAVATITTGGSGDVEDDRVSGNADVTAYLCENTWPDIASFPWSDDPTGAANGFAAEGAGYMNFSVSYCQDFGTPDVTSDDLPDVNVVLVPSSGASDVLKEYLFEIDSTSTSAGANGAGDAIGVRVLSNPEFLSPMAWYEEKGFSGSPSKTTIDGFQAVTDGRSAYVGVANVTSAGVYSNIVVLTYNEGASDETVDIYEQMLESVRFIRNVADDAVCSGSGNSCNADLDCDYGAGEVCGSDKLKIMRDTERLGELKDIARSVEAYGAENKTCSETSSRTCVEDADCPEAETCEAIVPELPAGTAVRALASSAWGSWGSTLGGALGGDVPTDPLNTYAVCDGYDAATCVNQTTGAYSCPEGSAVYHYRAVGSRKYELAAELEYTALPWVYELDTDDTDPVTYYTSSYCDGDIYGTSSACGDGVIGMRSDGTMEVCEVDDVHARRCTQSDGSAGTATAQCTSDCSGYTLAADAVCSAGTCGDGAIDAGEECDDGEFNGDYGYCGALCTYTDAEYCGDGVVSGGEACDCGDSTATTDLSESRPYGGAYGDCSGRNGRYKAAATTTCSWDCAGPAAYCGDANIDSGESCDGNTEAWAGALCSDGVTMCTTDADCSTGTCGDVEAACPVASICSGGSYDGYPCANFEWPSSVTSTFSSTYLAGFEAVMAARCSSGLDSTTTSDDGVCVSSGALYQTARTRTCDDSDAASICGWNDWQYCNYNGQSCGNGVVDGSEECDDGNDVATDGCTTLCTVNVCGDGYLYDGVEVCDEGTGNGGGCSSAYGSTCTACSTTCHYTVSSGDFCGDGVINGHEFCDGADVPYTWFNGYDILNPDASYTTNGSCSSLGETWSDGSTTYACRMVGVCNGGVLNGQYCTTNDDYVSGFDDVACGESSECVFPVCGEDCAATCPTSESTVSLVLTSNQPGDDATNTLDLYSYSAVSTSTLPNAATIAVPACTIAGNLVADVDFSNVELPDVYVVFVTDTSGSMAWEFGESSDDGDDIDERLEVAKTSINDAVATLFDELGSKMHIGLVHYSSAVVTDTVTFYGEASESALNTLVSAYSASGSTETDDGLDAAMALLDTVTDATNVAKMIVLLSDGQPGSESDVNAATLDVLQAEGVELYSLALTSTDTLETDMDRWSSNTICAGTETSLLSCDIDENLSSDPDSSSDYNDENLIDYSYGGTTASEVSAAYEAIIDSMLNGTASILSSSGTSVIVDTGIVNDSHNIVLPWPSEFACDGVNDVEVPIQITFRGEGTVQVSNVRVDYCAP